MKGSINFGSIFRRKDGVPDSKEQSGKGAVLERLFERAVTLKRGDLNPFTAGAPALEWTKVGDQITIPASAVEGLMEGRARIRACQLKHLEPAPIPIGTDDALEYTVLLGAIIPQIVDLLDPVESDVFGQPEFETPFSVLAREDSDVLAPTTPPNERQMAQPKPDVSPNGFKPSPPEPQHNQELMPDSNRSSPSLSALRALSRPPGDRLALPTDSVEKEPVVSQEPKAKIEQYPSSSVGVAKETAPAQREKQVQLPPSRQSLDDDRARLGVESLQEIFMTSRPLDGRKVASLVGEWPSVNGVLILMEGGVVLGGQLPEWLSLEAALQTPMILKGLTRFISEVERGQNADTRIVTVTSVTTMSLVASGSVVLLVSHNERKLPPGLSMRLAQTAEALNQIYGNADCL
jgi:hypothetical protein